MYPELHVYSHFGALPAGELHEETSVLLVFCVRPVLSFWHTVALLGELVQEKPDTVICREQENEPMVMRPNLYCPEYVYVVVFEGLTDFEPCGLNPPVWGEPPKRVPKPDPPPGYTSPTPGCIEPTTVYEKKS